MPTEQDKGGGGGEAGRPRRLATATAALGAAIACLGALTSADTVADWSTRVILLSVCAVLVAAAVAGAIFWPSPRWTILRIGVLCAALVVGLGAIVMYFATSDATETDRISDVCVGPEAITHHEETIWLGCVGTARRGTIVKIDASSKKVVGDPLEVDGRPHDLLVRGDRIWVFTYEGDLIEMRLDGRPTGRRIDKIVPEDNNGGDLTHDGSGSLWLNDWERGDVIRVGLSDFRRSKPFHVGDNATGLVYGAGSLWVTDSPGRRVLEVRDGGDVADTVDLPRGPNDKDADPQDIAVGLGRVWIADYANKRVLTIDLDKEAAGKERLEDRTYPVGRAASAVAVGRARVWVSSADDDNVTRIDPVEHSTETVAVGDEPVDITVTPDVVWTADHKTNSVSVLDLR
jgi:streptogramin lyase